MAQLTDAQANPHHPFLVPAGTPVGVAMRELNLPNTGPEAIVVVKDTEGHLKDLSHVPETDAEFLPIPANTAEGRAVIRHSCTHVLAQAVQQEFPGTKLGIGPAIDNGFYYDFDVAEPFTPEDLQRIEKRMKKIIKQGQKFERRVYADQAEAAEALKNEPYKLELIADKGSVDPQSDEATEVGAGELTGYYNLNPRTKAVEWYDLCRGPHVPTTKYIPAFALTRSSAAYWRGDQANAGLQRIYGTAWESQDQTPWRNTSTRWPKRKNATTGGSAKNSTCSPSPTKSAPGSPYSTQTAALCASKWKNTPDAATSRQATPSSTPHT